MVFRSAQSDHGERFEHFWKWLLPNGDFSREASVVANLDDKRKLRVIIKAHSQQRDMLSVQFTDSSRGSINWSVGRGGPGSLSEKPWPRMQFFSPRMSDPAV